MPRNLPEMAQPLPSLLEVVLDLLRNERDNWVQFREWVGNDLLPVSNTLQHKTVGVRLRIDNQYHVQFFIPEVGDFYYSGGKEITEAAELIVTLGNQIRAILALKYIEQRTPS